MKKVCFNLNIAEAYSIEFAIVVEVILKNLKEGDVFSLKQLSSALFFMTKNRIKGILSVMGEEGIVLKTGSKDGGLYLFTGIGSIKRDSAMASRILKEELENYKTNDKEEMVYICHEEGIGGGSAGKPISVVSEEGHAFAEWFKTTLPIRIQKRVNRQMVIEWARGYEGLLNRGYLKDDIRKACEYGRKDSFWTNNFFSPLKLLKKQPSSGLLYIDVFLNNILSDRERRVSRSVFDGVVL